MTYKKNRYLDEEGNLIHEDNYIFSRFHAVDEPMILNYIKYVVKEQKLVDGIQIITLKKVAV